jgi:hypothetical protein
MVLFSQYYLMSDLSVIIRLLLSICMGVLTYIVALMTIKPAAFKELLQVIRMPFQKEIFKKKSL